MDKLQRIKELAEERAGIMADLESVTLDLRVALVAALGAGEISELGAHKLTGVSRSVIRSWVGKT